jgi:hypothetical protein
MEELIYKILAILTLILIANIITAFFTFQIYQCLFVLL